MRWIWFAAVVAAGAGTWGVVNVTGNASAKTLSSEAPVVLLANSKVVKGIAFDGGRGMPLAQMRSVIGTEIGGTVDTAQLVVDRRAIESQLFARGYLAATVGTPTITYANGGAYIVFDIVRGPVFHLRSVEISGPGQSDADVVTLAAGDAALQDRIDQARASLAAAMARRANAESANVELMIHADREAAVVDLELVTR